LVVRTCQDPEVMLAENQLPRKRFGKVKRVRERGAALGGLPRDGAPRCATRFYGKVSFQLLMYPVSAAALSWTRSSQVPLAASAEAFTVYVVLRLSALPPVP